MLAPEVINLLPPKSFESKCFSSEETEKLINKLYFNHAVTILLPDTLTPPVAMIEALSNDMSYYCMKNVPVFELVNPQFLELFVKNGHLTLLSVKTRVDLDNCISIDPNGVLIMLLSGRTFRSSGLEGVKSEFSEDRFLVRMDLKSTNFCRGSKFHKRVAERLAAVSELKFDFIARWQPPDPATCPSSLAAWFSGAGYSVSTCPGNFERKTFYSVEVPRFVDNNVEELMEWAGMLLLDCDLKPENPAISLYQTPTADYVGQVVSLRYTGLFPPNPILTAFRILRDWSDKRGSLQWASLIIHGFEDSITSIGEKEHNFALEGDYNLNIILSPNKSTASLMHVNSWKRPK